MIALIVNTAGCVGENTPEEGEGAGNQVLMGDELKSFEEMLWRGVGL